MERPRDARERSGDRRRAKHYFPPDSVNREVLRESKRRTICPWRVEVHHCDVVEDEEKNRNAAWGTRNRKRPRGTSRLRRLLEGRRDHSIADPIVALLPNPSRKTPQTPIGITAMPLRIGSHRIIQPRRTAITGLPKACVVTTPIGSTRPDHGVASCTQHQDLAGSVNQRSWVDRHDWHHPRAQACAFSRIDPGMARSVPEMKMNTGPWVSSQARSTARPRRC